MTEPMMETLMQRVERLEQENWRLKMMGVAVLAGIVALVTIGQASCNTSRIGSGNVAKVIEAEQFILKDGNGRKRAALKVVEPIRGDAGLLLYDESGKQRADLTVTNLGVGELAFYASDVKPVVWLGSGRDEDSESGRLTLDTNHLKSGKRFRLQVDPDSLVLTGSGGGAVLRSDDDTGVSLSLNGKEGYSAVLGSAKIKITSTGTVETRPESSLVLFDKGGKVVWSAPR